MSTNLRKVFTAFGGNTKEIALLVSRLGYDGFAKMFFEIDQQRQAAMAQNEKNKGSEEVPVPNVSIRMGKKADELRKGEATRQAQTAQQQAQAGGAKHPEVAKLFQPWYEIEAEVNDYKAAGVADAELLAGYIARVNQFLETADTALAAIKDETLSSVRFKDSIRKVQELKQTATSRRDELGKMFEATSGKMTFAEQQMVPSARDLEDVKAKAEKLDLTPNQAWSVVGAGKKGADEKSTNRAKALERLVALNKRWGTRYAEDDLDTILRHLVNLPLATNYTFSRNPGANTGSNVEKTRLLKDLLMESDHFKNLWEIGASQASDNKVARGAVEEQMGYSSALKRQKGSRKDGVAVNIARPKDQDGLKPEERTFNPEDSRELPKYAGLVSDSQKDGVTERYGKSFVVWKDQVRERATHTPGDSWSNEAQGQGVKNFTSGKDPEVLFAHGDEDLLRLAAAEATGQDQGWLKKYREKGGAGNMAYFETQIHGDLTWEDVEKIVIDTTDGDAKSMAEDFKKFASQNGLKFKVEVKGG